MWRQKWTRFAFLLLLCLWLFHALLTSFYYPLSPAFHKEEAFIDEIMEQYPHHYSEDWASQMSYGEMDEHNFILDTFARQYPFLLAAVKETLTDDEKKRLGRPIRSQEDHVQLLDLFRPLITCPSLKKVGNGTAGRWTCGLETFLAQKTICRVYAFNWNVTDLSFELELLRLTSCELHLFDPFLAEEDQEIVSRVHPRLFFHNQTLGLTHDRRYLFDELSEDLQSVEEMNLHQIMAGQLHRWVDVIKLDYRGEEFTKVNEIIAEWRRIQTKRRRKQSFPVGQLLFELGTGGEAKKIAQVFIPVMNLGLAIFYMQPNLRTVQPWENIAVSFLNLKDNRTFYNDADAWS